MCYCCEDVITLDARVVDKVVFTRKRKPEESSLEMLSIAKCPSGFFDGEFLRTVGGDIRFHRCQSFYSLEAVRKACGCKKSLQSISGLSYFDEDENQLVKSDYMRHIVEHLNMKWWV
ncbi:hypothetical protein C5167_015273 [Papaver somniferum]|uniref:Uncharacterized protein n=1 Tax=Papaver somniferum TaxID=3469 RepID=A0A4Y7J913_PAPSO|nr:hypothetical protein C5167_015273 [Papaver somniferum]